MLIYRLLGYVSNIATFLCIITLGYYIFTAIRRLVKRERISFCEWIREIKYDVQNFAGSFTKVFLIVSLIATLITNTTIHHLVGIHNLKLKPEGTYCFYVEAQSYGGKTYTLPAQIRVEKETDEVNDKRKTYTYYYIEKVFFSNGGWLNTEDNEPVYINEPSYHYESGGDEWELVLLNEHAYSPYVEETNNASWLDMTFMFVEVLSISFLLYALCRKDE